MLIGKIMTSTKHRLMVTVEDHKGAKIVDLRSYQIINDGELVPTRDGISFSPEKVDAVIELLREAQKKIAGAPAR
ncbi:transcriptional coactivator p15/PC4 family protein [Syntrophorhabdus aromaticivorans]|nr:transcriptional coactivator p15/PC4 family protein [Syntrophorhabdus aromaticivorans]